MTVAALTLTLSPDLVAQKAATVGTFAAPQ